MPITHNKDVLTTGEVARLCHVAPRTVSKWFDTGELRGYRIPGSKDRRIPMRQLIAFMRAHGIPMNGLRDGACRVLIVDADLGFAVTDVFNDPERYEVRVAGNGFEAGVIAQEFRPQVIVLDVGPDAVEAAAICRIIKQTALLADTKVIAASAGLSDGRSTWFAARGFDGWLCKPYSPAQLVEAVEGMVNSFA